MVATGVCYLLPTRDGTGLSALPVYNAQEDSRTMLRARLKAPAVTTVRETADNNCQGACGKGERRRLIYKKRLLQATIQAKN
eukprot:9566975-Heterocapsa_arctica.AAC.1